MRACPKVFNYEFLTPTSQGLLQRSDAKEKTRRFGYFSSSSALPSSSSEEEEEPDSDSDDPDDEEYSPSDEPFSAASSSSMPLTTLSAVTFDSEDRGMVATTDCGGPTPRRPRKAFRNFAIQG